MKYGQKIFLMSFILTIIIINIIGIIMINDTYKSNMEKEIDKAMIQINSIMAELDKGVEDFSNTANIYLKNNVNVEWYQEGKRLYTNFKEEYPELEEKLFDKLDTMTSEEVYRMERQYYGENKNDITFYIKEDKLFMKMRKKINVIITLTDISEINYMKKEQVDFFTKLSLVSSILIALILYIMIFFLTRKIKLLNKIVNEVEKGNYSVKVKKLGKDEIGKVGQSFNNMTTAIEKNIEQIQEVSEKRKKFIGNLTHEIKTPLTSIIGYSSLIKNKRVIDNEIILEYCENIYEEGKYIEKISEKLMDLLLLENENIKLETINLSEELLKIIQELKSLFPNVKYEEDIYSNIYINTDKILLKSLIFNLVKNAINAYEKDPYIKIELDENKQIKIIDYGRGIPKQELEKVKEPFYTLSKDRNRKLSGMGLGLPLCIKIVEAQNGTLKIESKENEGTKIIIKFGG